MGFSDIRPAVSQTVSYSQNIRFSDCQTARLSDVRPSGGQLFSDHQLFSELWVPRLPDCQMSDHQVVSYSQTTRLSDCQLFSDYQLFSKHQVFRLSDVQTIRWSVIHRLPVITRTLDSQTTRSVILRMRISDSQYHYYYQYSNNRPEYTICVLHI